MVEGGSVSKGCKLPGNMSDPRAERRLSAVLSADAVGDNLLAEFGSVADAVNVAARPLGSIRA